MSEEQFSALLTKLKDDVGLQEKLKDAADLDAAVAIAKDAGFVISTEELQRAQAEISDQELEGVREISDEELEGVAAGWGATAKQKWKNLHRMSLRDICHVGE
jgi:predicted ribosomally synthesized peptide with nif11-like leader